MQDSVQFDPASVSFVPDTSTPLSRLLATLRAMVAEYPAGRTIRGDLEGRWITAASWVGAIRHLTNGTAVYAADFGCEGDALDYRTRAAQSIEESGLDAETSISGNLYRWVVFITIARAESA